MWEKVKAISTVLVVVVVCVKIYITPMSLTVDFPTLLSLLLALFSVALAALFYFKATDTSNAFYDNTYKFTGEISQLLAKIESGFGERLKHLDEGYSSLRTSFEGGGPNGTSKEEIEETKKELQEEKAELQRVMEDRNRMVRDLIEKSHLQHQEKKQVTTQLEEKEEALAQAQADVEKLNRRLTVERLHRQRDRFRDENGMDSYTRDKLIPKIGLERLRHASPASVRRLFDRTVDDLPPDYIRDLESAGYVAENELSRHGVEYVWRIARGLDS